MRKDGAEGEKENKGVSDCTVRTGDDVEVVSFKLSARLRVRIFQSKLLQIPTGRLGLSVENGRWIY